MIFKTILTSTLLLIGSRTIMLSDFETRSMHENQPDYKIFSWNAYFNLLNGEYHKTIIQAQKAISDNDIDIEYLICNFML